VSDLELALSDLGRHLELPPTPDLAARVRPRLAERPRRRRLPLRRPLVLALAGALLLGASAVAAVPTLRHAVLDALGIRGVQVRRVPTVPAGRPPTAVSGLDLGPRTTLPAAGRRAGFRVLIPSRLGAPDEVHLRTPPREGLVSLVYLAPGSRRVRHLLSETRGAGSQRFLMKTIGPGTQARNVRVGAAKGAWITGRPHEVVFADARGQIVADTLRLAGPTLLWDGAGLVLRLEGARSLIEALAIARSLK
jgi:hypothetical protein